MPWPAGFAIHEREVTPDPELVEALRGVPTTIVSDCLGSCVGAVGLPVFARGRSHRRPSKVPDVRAKQAQEEQQQRHHLDSRRDPSLLARDGERVDALLRARCCPV